MLDLRDQFPSVFSKAFDVSVPPGWEPLVARLIQRILEALDPEVRDQFRIRQAKEKFGHLVIYHNGDQEIQGLVEAADEECRRTCQLCGKPGKPVEIGGWYGVLCVEDERRERG